MNDLEKIDAIEQKLLNRYLDTVPAGGDPWAEQVPPLDPALAGIANFVRARCRRLDDNETLPIDRPLIYLHPFADSVAVVEAPAGKANVYRNPPKAQRLTPVERYTPKEAA